MCHLNGSGIQPFILTTICLLSQRTMALQNCKASSNNDFASKLINKVQHSTLIFPIITCRTLALGL